MSFNRHKEIATKFPKFQTEAAMRFYPLVKKRVDDYFKEKGISPSANTQMHIKSIALLLMYLVPFVLILTLNTPFWAFYALCAFMGLGMAGVGMGVMHDGNHGSYSNKSWVNNLTGASMFLLSGNVVTWKIQHNVLHHTYTNIHGHDEDVETGGLIRLHSGSEWKKAHKYQHLYAPFLYGLMTLNWLLVKDFKQMGRYHRGGLLQRINADYKKEMRTLIISKILNYSIFIGLPIFLSGHAWYFVLLGIVLMHFVAGVTLSFIFQLAHVVNEADQSLPMYDEKMPNSWSVHQLYTTADFCHGNKLVTWFVGGLNYQVEHHIFPNICHIHYPKIAKIVESTAKELNLPYFHTPKLSDALKSHFSALKTLGRDPGVSQMAMA